MGSCTIKVPKPNHSSKVISTVQLKPAKDIRLSYLSPQVRYEIFDAKDSKAPILNIKLNHLYAKRMQLGMKRVQNEE